MLNQRPLRKRKANENISTELGNTFSPSSKRRRASSSIFPGAFEGIVKVHHPAILVVIICQAKNSNAFISNIAQRYGFNGRLGFVTQGPIVFVVDKINDCYWRDYCLDHHIAVRLFLTRLADIYNKNFKKMMKEIPNASSVQYVEIVQAFNQKFGANLRPEPLKNGHLWVANLEPLVKSLNDKYYISKELIQLLELLHYLRKYSDSNHRLTLVYVAPNQMQAMNIAANHRRYLQSKDIFSRVGRYVLIEDPTLFIQEMANSKRVKKTYDEIMKFIKLATDSEIEDIEQERLNELKPKKIALSKPTDIKAENQIYIDDETNSSSSNEDAPGNDLVMSDPFTQIYNRCKTVIALNEGIAQRNNRSVIQSNDLQHLQIKTVIPEAKDQNLNASQQTNDASHNNNLLNEESIATDDEVILNKVEPLMTYPQVDSWDFGNLNVDQTDIDTNNNQNDLLPSQTEYPFIQSNLFLPLTPVSDVATDQDFNPGQKSTNRDVEDRSSLFNSNTFFNPKNCSKSSNNNNSNSNTPTQFR